MRLGVELETQGGEFITDLGDYVRISVSRSLNNIGEGTVTLPNRFTPDFFQEFMRLRITHPESGELVGGTRWHIKGDTYDGDSDTLGLIVVDDLGLLAGEIVAYPADSVYADKTLENGNNGPIDDLMRQYVRENGGPSTVEAYNKIPTLTVEPDRSVAGVSSKEAAYQSLVDVLREFAEESKGAGLPLYFGLIHNVVTNTYQFVVRPILWGVDRSESGAVFSQSAGKLISLTVTRDYRDKADFIYVGGDGNGLDRIIGTASRVGLLKRSPFDVALKFVDAGDTVEDAVMTAEGYAALERGRVRRVLTAGVADTPAFRFGTDYFFGDQVLVEVASVRYKAIIDAFSLSAENDTVTPDIRLAGEEPWSL